MRLEKATQLKKINNQKDQIRRERMKMRKQKKREKSDNEEGFRWESIMKLKISEKGDEKIQKNYLKRKKSLKKKDKNEKDL